MTQPCMLQATPNPVNFGFAPIAETSTVSVTLESVGTESCNVSRVALTDGSALAYSISGWGGFAVMQPGDTRDFEVRFYPTSPGSEVGGVGIWIGLPIGGADLTIPIQGLGSGPALCVAPSPVPFGSHPVGATEDRLVSLTNCGSEDLDLTSVGLSAATPSVFSIEAAAPLGIVAPGDSAQTTLRFTATMEGTFQGRLVVASNDATSPSTEVLLVASASNGPCGDITGVVCGLDGSSPAGGARVFVDTGNGIVETIAEEGGEFVLSCVPPGTQTVTAQSGNWSTTFTVNVVGYQTTTVAEPQCLDPGSANIAVVTGEWDQIGGILDGMNIDYTSYDGYSDEDFGNTDIDALMNDLDNYDIVFLSCGMDESEFSAGDIAALAAFVQNGGSLYGSDYAYDLLEGAFSDAFDFFGDDTVPGVAEGAGSFLGQDSFSMVACKLRSGVAPTFPLPVVVRRSRAWARFPLPTSRAIAWAMV